MSRGHFWWGGKADWAQEGVGKSGGIACCILIPHSETLQGLLRFPLVEQLAQIQVLLQGRLGL